MHPSTNEEIYVAETEQIFIDALQKIELSIESLERLCSGLIDKSGSPTGLAKQDLEVWSYVMDGAISQIRDRYHPHPLVVFRGEEIIGNGLRILEIGGHKHGYYDFFSGENYLNVDLWANGTSSDKQLPRDARYQETWDLILQRLQGSPDIIFAQNFFEDDYYSHLVDFPTVFRQCWRHLNIGGRMIVFNPNTLREGLERTIGNTPINVPLLRTYRFSDVDDSYENQRREIQVLTKGQF